jgi:hypothetical protein
MLKPEITLAVPEKTKAAAKQAFSKRNIYLTLRDKLGPIFEDELLVDLYPSLG